MILPSQCQSPRPILSKSHYYFFGAIFSTLRVKSVSGRQSWSLSSWRKFAASWTQSLWIFRCRWSPLFASWIPYWGCPEGSCLKSWFYSEGFGCSSAFSWNQTGCLWNTVTAWCLQEPNRRTGRSGLSIRGLLRTFLYGFCFSQLGCNTLVADWLLLSRRCIWRTLSRWLQHPSPSIWPLGCLFGMIQFQMLSGWCQGGVSGWILGQNLESLFLFFRWKVSPK